MNSLHVSLSDYVVDLGLLQRKEEQHLLKNLKYRYPKMCEICRVKVCNIKCEEVSGLCMFTLLKSRILAVFRPAVLVSIHYCLQPVTTTFIHILHVLLF